MIRVNLLPHREIRRAEMRKMFFIALGAAAAVGVVLVGLWGVLVNSSISSQSERNAYLKTRNEQLDRQLKEIATLKQEIDSLKARQKAVEDLQADRNIPVQIFEELVKNVPEGIYLKSAKQDAKKVAIVGYSQSQERVAELLRSMSSGGVVLKSPELVEIKTSTLSPSGAANPKDPRRLNEFAVNLTVKRQKTEAEEKEEAAKNQPKLSASVAGRYRPIAPPPGMVFPGQRPGGPGMPPPGQLPGGVLPSGAQVPTSK